MEHSGAQWSTVEHSEDRSVRMLESNWLSWPGHSVFQRSAESLREMRNLHWETETELTVNCHQQDQHIDFVWEHLVSSHQAFSIIYPAISSSSSYSLVLVEEFEIPKGLIKIEL